MQSDILILGGGLAGCAAAVTLARAGRDVTLVEREPTPRHKVCGEFLSAEALHLLAQLSVDPLAHGAHRIGTVRLASRGHVVPSALPFPAQSLTRRCLDTLMLDAAKDAGARVLRGTGVQSLTRSNHLWQAGFSTGGTVCARQAILATGKHDLRGFPRPPGVQGDLVALKMYFRLAPDEAAALANSVELLLHPHGYTGLQPVENGAANVTALVRRAHLATLGGWGGLLAEIRGTNPHAARRLRNAEPLLDKPLAIASIPYGFVRKGAVAPHLWAVGDQAAVIPSFTGDGMSIALYTGCRAAESLLANETADAFQRALGSTLHGQVTRATALSRALIHTPTRDLLTTCARLWPGGLRLAASVTRLPAIALHALATSSSGA